MNKNKPILVTGATGYIAGWIIDGLLNLGHTVHGTVRDPSNILKTQHLYDIAEKSSGELKLFKANLLEPGSFDAAMQDCEIVIHTASPFMVTKYKDALTDIIEPAVLGTENVLNSVNNTPSVKRVVLTSSIASIYGDAIEIECTSDKIFNEDNWNNTSNHKHQPYSYSKVAAERKALEMSKRQSRWELVCINPALVMGPSLTASSQSGSIEILQQFGNGLTFFGVPDMWIGIVDVRDVADAHIAAALTPQVKGRYIISGGTLSFLQIGKILAEKFSYKYPFPRFTVPKFLFFLVAPIFGYSRQFVRLNIGYPVYFNTMRSEVELGIKYRDIKVSIRQHFQQLIDDGIIKNRN